MKFKNSVAAWKVGIGFDEAFERELLDNPDLMPLFKFCNQGGWPDDDTIEIEIVSVNTSDDLMIISVSVRFTECVPTSCSDIFMSDSGFASLTFELDLDTAKCKCLLDEDYI